MNNITKEIYYLCTETTNEMFTTILNGKQVDLSLVGLRNTALEGGCEDDKEAYIGMIEAELKKLYGNELLK